MRKINYKNKNRGQVMMITMILFLAASLIAIFGIISPVIQHMRVSYNFGETKQAFYLSESGIEDALYRLTAGKQVSPSYDISLGGFTTTVTTSNISTGKKIVSSGNRNDFIRNTEIDLALGDGISFHYGIQSGNGGFVLQNSSTVTGNVFSSGTITGSGNNIFGDVISAGSSGLINNIHATGTAYAHTIQNSTIDKNAYYTIKTSTTVGGTSFPGSPDQSPADLPISDAQINEWESDAAAGGTATCSGGTYSISSGSVTIGPLKIPCDLVISNSAVVTIDGHIWVQGNITVQNSAIVKMAASLGANNVAIIADNPSDRINSSTITIKNTTTFQNSGTTGSFVFLISQNNSAENGGSIPAFSISNNSSALVAYASHGLIPLANSVSLKEVTAYKITLQNSANVTYDTGLPSALFQAGPSGGYDILIWKEN